MGEGLGGIDEVVPSTQCSKAILMKTRKNNALCELRESISKVQRDALTTRGRSAFLEGRSAYGA